MSKLTNGDPSRRLQSVRYRSSDLLSKYVLIQDNFLVLSAGLDSISQPAHTVRIRHGSLQKSAVSTEDI
jgi:hypothetical protein